MRNRIEYLDAIRGLSIIGILFVNITSFSWPEQYDSIPSQYWSSPIEKIMHSLISVFAQSSFYPVFALLFGISMWFVFNGAKSRGLHPNIVFSRRLLFLLAVGLTHAVIVWQGDILTIYAILGFFLLLFYRMNTKALFITAATIWILPNVLYAIFLLLINYHLTPIDNSVEIKEVIQNYHSGMLSIINQNAHDWLEQFSAFNLPFLFISIFPMFLFGLAIAKSGWLSRTEDHAKKITMLWVGFGLVGFTLKLLPIFQPNYLLWLHLGESFGGPLVGFFYALTIIKFYAYSRHGGRHSRHSRHGRHIDRIHDGLSSIGKMSMSNYLFQSLMGLIIFKVLGLYGTVSPLLTLLTAYTIVLIQIPLSRLWLKKHPFGPVEYVWRKFTYLETSKPKNLKVS